MKSGGKTLASWSGGKDSCLALWRSQLAGQPVQRLLTALDETGQRARSHGVPPALLRAQACALGAEMQFLQTGWSDYETRFVTALRQARADGFGRVVFGDIDLQAHRDWEEQVCAQAGLRAELPLWRHDRMALVREFWAAGFKAVVVCVDGRWLGPQFAGRPFDEEFVERLPAGVDACGENGEFHTFVHDGPNFSQPVAWELSGHATYVAPAQFGGATYHFGVIEAARIGQIEFAPA